MRERDDHMFLPLRDAVASINRKVDIIGVIIEFGFPYKSKGTDCFCILKIVDESHKKPGISINVFAEDFEKLPHVASAGDVIQLLRVVMKTHGREVYAVFNKKFSSFALYEGRISEDYTPYQISSKFCQREHDKKLISSVRNWLVDFHLDEGLTKYMLFREIEEGESCNLCCKILHISEVSKGVWMAFLWDGTDTPPANISATLEDEERSPLRLQLEPYQLPRDLLCTFPDVGTILRVFLDQEKKCGLDLQNTDRWVKFFNIRCEVCSGLWCGVLTPFTKLKYMDNKDPLLLERIRLYEERISVKSERMIPFWCFPLCPNITVVDYEEVALTNLMNVLTSIKVTAKFKCMVRVVAVYPWKTENIRSPLGIYRIRLTLEDPTARIHAFVYAEDGDQFFNGYPSVDVLRRKLHKLLGISASDNGQEIKDAPRNPPWVMCCLKSYYIDRSDVWGSRQYRVFGTRLMD